MRKEKEKEWDDRRGVTAVKEIKLVENIFYG